MTATSSDPPTISLSGDLVVHNVLRGVWLGITSSPIITIAILVLLAAAAARSVRRLKWSGASRDPVRRFGTADRAIIKARAAHRCEHHAWFFGRCRVTENLEADHVHPHSRAGQTKVANGQALCRRHNRLKSARIPFDRELRQLAKRRTAYFPAGVPTEVRRRADH